MAFLAGGAMGAESEIEADVPNGPLEGTLLMPDSGTPLAAAVIIPGSGPTDRNGNNPLGITAMPYKLLAEALVAQGVANVRVDKRGMFGSDGNFGDPNAVKMSDYAGDARAWARRMVEATGSRCAWIIGHSEGGLTALVADSEDDPAICGLVLVSAPGRRFADLLRDQLWSNPANWPLIADALAAIAALEAGQRVDVSKFHPALQNLFAPVIQDYLIDVMSYDPAALIRREKKPVMILQGDNDLQVKLIDAEQLYAAKPDAELVIMPGVNHVLKVVPKNDVAANMASYADPSLPLAPGLGEAIAKFMLKSR
jgi:pimeloyl-ACP methyl ester carboxylesterase